MFKSKPTCWGWLLGVLWSRFQHIAKMNAPSHFLFSLEGKNVQRRMVHSLGVDMTRAWWPYWDSPAGDRFLQGSVQKRVLGEAWGGAVLSVGATSGGWKTQQGAGSSTVCWGTECGPARPGWWECWWLPSEFYKSFWPVLREHLLHVLRESLSWGQLPLSCRRTVLTLKKRALQDMLAISVLTVHRLQAAGWVVGEGPDVPCAHGTTKMSRVWWRMVGGWGSLEASWPKCFLIILLCFLAVHEIT